jgi:hypothetical protein
MLEERLVSKETVVAWKWVSSGSSDEEIVVWVLSLLGSPSSTAFSLEILM